MLSNPQMAHSPPNLLGEQEDVKVNKCQMNISKAMNKYTGPLFPALWYLMVIAIK